MKLFHLQKPLSKWRYGYVRIFNTWNGFCKQLKILYSSDYPILIRFRQLVVNIVNKKLQMVFLTSTVINSKGNMKELERKIKCEKLMFR